MKNAIKYGLIIGVLSGIWILIMHFAGVYEQEYPKSDKSSWLEYASVIIPAIGLYLGIKNYRDNINGGTMEFFEGIFEGFKIMALGGIIAAFFAVVYISYVNSTQQISSTGRYRVLNITGYVVYSSGSMIWIKQIKTQQRLRRRFFLSN